MSAAEKQKTILKAGSISGIGLHTGKMSQIFFKPAPADAGIRFFKSGALIGVLGRDSSLSSLESVARCSAIGDEKVKILTVEHLLAAIYGLRISNLEVDVRGEEIPGVDGSAAPFARLFRELGIVDQGKKKYIYPISRPLFCHENGKAISIFPSDKFEVSYCLDYDIPGLRDQKVDFAVSPAVFQSQIAPARTFCTLEEARYLKQSGFGLGGNPENNIVVSPDGSHEKSLRFPDECVRHKVLDIIGDLSLLGFPVTGKVIGIRSGHSLNRKLVQAIRRQKDDDGK